MAFEKLTGLSPSEENDEINDPNAESSNLLQELNFSMFTRREQSKRANLYWKSRATLFPLRELLHLYITCGFEKHLMPTIGFLCDSSYKCVCTRWTLVSEKTANKHRHAAMKKGEDGHGTLFWLPLPKAIFDHGELPPLTSSDESSGESGSSSSDSPICTDDSIATSRTDSISTASPEAQTRQPLEDSLEEESDQTPERELLPLVEQNDDRAHYSETLTECQDLRFKNFMQKHCGLLGLGIRHNATGALMNDLVEDATADEVPGMRYKTFDGVRNALLRNSGFVTHRFPSCPVYHQALSVNPDHTINPCDYCPEQTTFTGHAEYLCVWERLEAQLLSPNLGPRMFDYFQKGVQSAFAGRGPDYTDFFSGNLFRRVVQRLGGKDKVKYDIFLSLSADGVNPFESDPYTYWPVVATILNLPPSERYKAKNLLPIVIIPGPRDPKSLTSFLRPFIDEMKELSTKGRMVRLWNSSLCRVRVHLLFVHSDLPAMAKLTHTKGHGGLVPCRFCSIRGVFVNHSYFPHQIVEEIVTERRRKRKKVVKALWDIDKLPLRTEAGIESGYAKLKDVAQNGTVGALNDLKKDLGFSSVDETPLLELHTLFPFASFPPDIMHLLFLNVAKDMLGIWVNDSGKYPDIGYLGSSREFNGVSDTLRRCGSGIPATICRRPRSLESKGSWKANEWKVFVLSTSLIALHEWVPRNVLDGWHTFVQVVQRVCQWELSEDLVNDIEELSKQFYRHFADHYYQYRPERIHLCKYVLHLLLHLADSIRDCGPVSLLAQWAMENFAGQANRQCSAKNLFAESVRETIKYQEAARLYGIHNNMKIPYVEDEAKQVSKSLRCKSDLEKLDGFELMHPRSETTVDLAVEQRFPKLKLLLKRYYQTSLRISAENANSILQENPKLTVWDRLFHENTALMGEMTYRLCAKERNDKDRSASFFSASFQNEDMTALLVSYGNAIGFLEHQVGNVVHILVLARWVTKGLHKGRQGQIYAKTTRDHSSLFSTSTVESVDCISHPISVVEAKVPNNRGTTSNRTYFIDDMREPNGILSGCPWRRDTEKMQLQGLVRR